jgi:hypothetical protein
MNDNPNYDNRSSNLQVYQEDNQLYHSQHFVPGLSMQKTSVEPDTYLVHHFYTTHGNSTSGCLYQDPKYAYQY